jgi:hypothetical protein
MAQVCVSAGVLLLIACFGCWHSGGAIDGTYLQSPGGGERAPGAYAGDCLRIESRGDEAIFFDVVLVEESHHSCSASGVARRVGSSQVFEATMDLVLEGESPCRVQIEFADAYVAIDGLDFACRHYCGAGAVLEARFHRSRRQRPASVCEEAPTPDLESLEDAARRLLREKGLDE